MNYFNVLGIEENFNIDKVDLESKYISLQKNHHPDIAYDNKSRNISIMLDINTAYNILKDDLSRAIYILKTKGLDIEDESQRFSIDIKLLDKILSQQEIIEELTDKELIANSLNEVNKRINEIVTELCTLFANSDYKKALIFTIELKYLDTLKRNIIKKLR